MRGLRRRLDRLWAAYRREAAEREAETDRLAARDIMLAATRAGLARAGIDPGLVPALRRFAAPEPVPRPQAARHAPGPFDLLREQLSGLVRRCREHPPNLAEATPAELFAMYCLDAAPSG